MANEADVVKATSGLDPVAEQSFSEDPKRPSGFSTLAEEGRVLTPMCLAKSIKNSNLTTQELLTKNVDHTNNDLSKITRKAAAVEASAQKRMQDWTKDMAAYIESLEGAKKDRTLDRQRRTKQDMPEVKNEEHKEKKTAYSQTTRFQMVITFLIMINSVLLGLQVDHPVEEYPTVGKILEQVDFLFVVIFFIEMIWKLYDLHWGYFKVIWNCGDFVIVSVSIADTFIKVTENAKEEKQNIDVDLGVLKVLRVFRMLRIARIVRLVRHFEALYLIVSGFINALSPISWVVVLLLIINYCIAILMTSEVGHDPRYDLTEVWDEPFDARQYFGSMTRTMFTLFQAIIGAEFTEWSRPIYERQPEMLIPIVIFTVVCNFGAVNVIIGVICDRTREAAQAAEKDCQKLLLKKRRLVAEEIIQFIHSSGISDDNVVSLIEFEDWLISRDFNIEELNVPLAVSARELYEYLDTEGVGNVPTTVLIKNLFRLTQQNQSSALFLVQIALNRLSKVEFKTEKRLGHIEALLRKQLGISEEEKHKEIAVQTSGPVQTEDVDWLNDFRSQMFDRGFSPSPCASPKESLKATPNASPRESEGKS